MLKNKFLLILISFFFVNGIVYILDNKLGFFNIIHSAMLQSISSSKDIHSEYDEKSDSVVILLTNKIFEEEFNAQTPLNKEKLSEIVTKIAQQKPKSIVFDLDISPDYNFSLSKQMYSDDIYEVLQTYANEIDIILPFTFIAQTNKNKELKLDWVKKMCQHNIHFGIPFLTNEIGSVLKYYENPNHVSLTINKENGICNDIKNITVDDFENIQNKYFKENKRFNSSAINYEQINNHTIYIDSINDLTQYNFQDKVIFLGGGYGFDDKYITPYGEKFGVEILNSIFYSSKYHIETADVLKTLIVYDLCIGMLFGWLLNFLLNKRDNIDKEYLLFLNNSALLLLILMFYFISLLISGIFFHYFYLWMNPVPLLIGMFLDGILNLGKKSINQDIDSLLWHQKCIHIFSYSLKGLLVILGIYALFNSL